jgi:2-amino-4-hydroxy-6-hydroxymethyldihydropteridine diphosphokinase
MSQPAPVTAYIGVGANLGDAVASVRQAIEQLQHLPDSRLSAQSALFRTAPVEATGDYYVNAVIALQTSLAPQTLLEALQQIEQAFGRERPYRNAPRTLDLDILLYGNQEMITATLTVPHPRLTQRAFALIPLLQLDPFITIPGHGPAHAFAPAVAHQPIARII